MRAIKMSIEQFRDLYAEEQGVEAAEIGIAGDETGYYFVASGRPDGEPAPPYIEDQPWSYLPGEVMDNLRGSDGWYAYIAGRFYEMPWLDEESSFPC